MSLKTRRHQQQAHQSQGVHRSTVNSVLGMLNDNKFLIGSVVAASGAAVFLFGTQSGKRVRDEMQTRHESDELAA